MRRPLVLLLACGLALAACTPPPPQSTAQPVRLVRCDDGGSGGVMIDGVCL